MKHQEEQTQEVSIIKRTLLVEDYEACQRIMSHYLYELGYQVDLTVDGTKAIQHLHSKVYDLIVIDIQLSGVSGKEVIQDVRDSKLNAGTPLIVWSAFVNKNNEEKYLAWGVDGVLIKACQITDLEKAIQKCFLTPRYERNFFYRLNTLQKKWQGNCSTGWIKKINDLRHLPYSILDEALHIIGEYQQWLDFHAKEGKNLS